MDRVVEEVHLQLDGHVRSRRHGREHVAEAGQGQEAAGAVDDYPPALFVPRAERFGVDPGADNPPQDGRHGQGEPGDHACQEVHEHHGQQRDGVDGHVSGDAGRGEVGHLHQPHADDDQQARQDSHRNQLDDSCQQKREDQDPDTVKDGGLAGPRPGFEVGGAAHDNPGDGQAAQHAGRDVCRALADEFTVEICAFAVVHPVHGHRGEQRFDARHQGDRHDADDDGAPVSARQLRQGQRVQQGPIESDAVDVGRQRQRQRRGGDDRHQGRGDAPEGRRHVLPAQQQQDHGGAQDRGLGVQRGDARREGFDVLPG